MSNKTDLKIDQLCNLIGLESNFQPSTVRRVLDATYKVILKQLELNQRIYFLDFGAFELYERAGGDKIMGDLVNGGAIIRYVEPRNKILFKPSDPLDKAINEGNFEAPTRKKKKYRKSHSTILKEYYQKNKMVNKPTAEELVHKALNVSKARAENAEEWEVRRIKDRT